MISITPELASSELPPITPDRKPQMTRLTAVRPPDITTVLGVGIVGSLITFLRSPDTLRAPELYAEDGRVWFADAYQRGPIHPLFVAHTGYLQTFPRLVADLGLLVPLGRLPLLFVLVAVPVQVMPAALVASRRFATLVPSFSVRLLLALTYLLIPNSAEVNSNLTNAQWHLALLAFMVVVADEEGRWWRAFDVVVVVLSGLTGPFVIVLAPIAVVVFVVRKQRWTRILTAMLCIAAVVQIVYLLTSPRGSHASLGITPARFAEIIGGQVVGGTVLGPPATEAGHVLSNLPLAGALLMVVGGSICAAALVRGPLELRLLNIFAVAVLTSSLISPVGTGVEAQWQALTGDAGARYWFIPAVALVVDLIWLAGQVQWWRGVPTIAAVVVLAASAAFGARSSFEYPSPAPRPNWPAEVRAFDHVKEGQRFTFEITPDGWTFSVVKN